MPVYNYRALNKDGTTVKASHTADNKEQLMQFLRARGQSPISIKESGNLLNFSSSHPFTRVSTTDISVFCRQFYTMYKAGVPIVICLDTIRQQTPNKKLKASLDEVYEELQEGVTFSDSLRHRPNVFPELLISMVEAGDTSGTLDIIMLRMSQHYEKEKKINAKIQSAMIYPMVLMVISIFVVVFLLVFIMPGFLELFKESDTELPALTQFLLSLSDIIVHYWYIIIAVIFVVGYVIRRLFKTFAGRMFIDTLKLRLPYINSVIKKIIASRFTRTLSTLISSGIPLMQALEIVSRVVNNKVAEKGILEAKDMVARGITLSNPIKDIGIFPPMVVSMIKIGEESGMLDEILNQTANFYDEEVETAMQSMTAILEPLMIVVMALLVGGIVIAMVMPMFSMLGAIDKMVS